MLTAASMQTATFYMHKWLQSEFWSQKITEINYFNACVSIRQMINYCLTV